jgi:2-amino-4-hydroxy-6-hydroxymethyldihydropteridine diphosphokinase
MTRVAISLGSNIGDRDGHLNKTKGLLERVLSDIKVSSFLNNKALLKPDAPLSWDMDYLNCVVVGHTDYGPNCLLQELKKIEKEVSGLQKRSWAPREIDIDVLLYGSVAISDNGLVIPHRELLNREFLLELLSEIVADAVDINSKNILILLK